MNEKSDGLSSDKLNLIIAVCAILISLASFYATYLQADAAEKQVKVMTLPIMDFGHGNYDAETKSQILNFSISNSGMGAAIVQSIKLKYKEKYYRSYNDFLRACCNAEFEQFLSTKAGKGDELEGGIVSSPINQIVMTPQSSVRFFSIHKHPDNSALWEKIDRERWNLQLEFCYCTLLDDCFVSQGKKIAKQVEACEV